MYSFLFFKFFIILFLFLSCPITGQAEIPPISSEASSSAVAVASTVDVQRPRRYDFIYSPAGRSFTKVENKGMFNLYPQNISLALPMMMDAGMVSLIGVGDFLFPDLASVPARGVVWLGYSYLTFCAFMLPILYNTLIANQKDRPDPFGMQLNTLFQQTIYLRNFRHTLDYRYLGSFSLTGMALLVPGGGGSVYGASFLMNPLFYFLLYQNYLYVAKGERCEQIPAFKINSVRYLPIPVMRVAPFGDLFGATHYFSCQGKTFLVETMIGKNDFYEHVYGYIQFKTHQFFVFKRFQFDIEMVSWVQPKKIYHHNWASTEEIDTEQLNRVTLGYCKKAPDNTQSLGGSAELSAYYFFNKFFGLCSSVGIKSKGYMAGLFYEPCVFVKIGVSFLEKEAGG